MVKSDSASVLIPSLEFEIPARTQRGSLNTIEGLIRNAADGLSADQDYRRQAQPEIAAKIQVVIDKLRALVAPLQDDDDEEDEEEDDDEEEEDDDDDEEDPSRITEAPGVLVGYTMAVKAISEETLPELGIIVRRFKLIPTRVCNVLFVSICYCFTFDVVSL